MVNIFTVFLVDWDVYIAFLCDAAIFGFDLWPLYYEW